MPRGAKGQSLVEWAFLFPIVMLTIVMIAHLLILVRVKMELGRTAARLADAAALGQSTMPQAAAEGLRFSRYIRWGIPTDLSPSVHVFTPYRNWNGRASLQTPGQMAIANVSFRFRSRAATRGLALMGLPLSARAEFPLEPLRPQEGA